MCIRDRLITVYTGSANLFVVPYTKPQEYIRDNAPDVLFTVLMRRSIDVYKRQSMCCWAAMCWGRTPTTPAF